MAPTARYPPHTPHTTHKPLSSCSVQVNPNEDSFSNLKNCAFPFAKKLQAGADARRGKGYEEQGLTPQTLSSSNPKTLHFPSCIGVSVRSQQRRRGLTRGPSGGGVGVHGEADGEGGAAARRGKGCEEQGLTRGAGQAGETVWRGWGF